MRMRQFGSQISPALLVLLVATTAQAGGATFILQPVAPKTVPPSDYPPGTTIVGQEIILGSVPARVWLEVHVTGFPTTDSPNCVKSVGVRIDAQDVEMNGGGYFGAHASCSGSPAIGAGDINNAQQACANNTDCRNTMSGRTSACFAGEPSSCFGGYCSYALMDRCDPEWICAGIDCLAAISLSTISPRLVATVDEDSDACMNDFLPSYVATLIVDMPANAKGTYTLDFGLTETYLSNGNHVDIPIAAFISARITVPCGRCCYGVNTSATGCVEGVSAVECATYAPSAVFEANLDCPDSGGPACPVCALDEHCDDGLYCNGPEVCEVGGVCGPGNPPCESYEACEESTDSCAPRIPAIGTWGMIALGLLILIAAKLNYRRLPTSTFAFLFALGLCSSPGMTFAQFGGASITLQPVAPKTVPPSDYPPGTTIVGQEIILGSVPARVWLEVHVTGWAPEQLKTVSVKLNQYGDPNHNYSDAGFSGENAMCGDDQAIGAGDLRVALQPCTTSSDCRSALTGMTEPCSLNPQPVSCSGNCFWAVFADFCDLAWIGAGIRFLASWNCDSGNCGIGASADPQYHDVLQDFEPSYLGTFVVDVPGDTKGTYTIGFVEVETFLQNDTGNQIPIAALIPAKITVPCGRCCYGVNTSSTGCVEGVSAVECATYAPSAVFEANLDCPDSGGPPCPLCALDEHCDDGLHCNGPEVCEAGGVCGPGDPPCESYEACEESTDSCAPRIPAVSNWGLIILILSLLVTAKLRYRRTTAKVINSLR